MVQNGQFWVLENLLPFFRVFNHHTLAMPKSVNFTSPWRLWRIFLRKNKGTMTTWRHTKTTPPVILNLGIWRLQLASYTLWEIHHPPEITGPQYDWLFLQVAMVLSSSKSLVDFWNRCCNRVEISIDDQCWAKDLWFDISVQHLLPWLHSDADLHPFECVSEFPKWWCHVVSRFFKPYPWI